MTVIIQGYNSNLFITQGYIPLPVDIAVVGLKARVLHDVVQAKVMPDIINATYYPSNMIARLADG